jgi:hypothetical protein
MEIRVTDLDPFAADGILRIECPHCVRAGKPRGERAILLVSLDAHPPVDVEETTGFENLSLDGILDFPGEWQGVIKKGIVGTIVPLVGHAVAVGSAVMGGRRMSEAERARSIAVRSAMDAISCVQDLPEAKRAQIRAMLERELEAP